MNLVYKHGVEAGPENPSEWCLSRSRNNNDMLEIHPIYLFTDKAKEQRIAVCLKTLYGVKLCVDNSYPSTLGARGYFFTWK